MIHLLAFVDQTVTIGANTMVWQFASVIRGAVLGDDCIIGSCSVVDGAIVGDGCSISHGAQIHPGTKIGDRVFVGPGAIICNDMWPSVEKAGFELEPDRFTAIIEDDASIGAGAILLPGVRVGKGAFVAAGAVVERDVPPGCGYRRNGYVALQRPQDWRERRMRWVA